LKLFLVKLKLPGNPTVDLERVDQVVDAVETFTSDVEICFTGIKMLAGTSFIGVDFLRTLRLPPEAGDEHFCGIYIKKAQMIMKL
jgi:hypothetical protein